MGENNFQADDGLLALLTLERTELVQITEEETVWSSIESHLNFLNNIKKLTSQETEFLLYLLDEVDEIIVGVYECFSLTLDLQELIETLRILCVQLDEQPDIPEDVRGTPHRNSDIGDCSRYSYSQASPQGVPEQGRDSWPRNFGKVIDSNKVTRMLFSFKHTLEGPDFEQLNKVETVVMADRRQRRPQTGGYFEVRFGPGPPVSFL